MIYDSLGLTLQNVKYLEKYLMNRSETLEVQLISHL